MAELEFQFNRERINYSIKNNIRTVGYQHGKNKIELQI